MGAVHGRAQPGDQTGFAQFCEIDDNARFGRDASNHLDVERHFLVCPGIDARRIVTRTDIDVGNLRHWHLHRLARLRDILPMIAPGGRDNRYTLSGTAPGSGHPVEARNL